MQRIVGLIFPMVAAIALFSCRPVASLQYVQGTADTQAISNFQIPEPVIQRGDLLSIIVYSDNAQNTALYNLPMVNNVQSGGNGSVATPVGYMVDNEGNIQFQGLGSLHVEGLTKKGLSQLLDSRLKDTLLNNPYYAIRFLNFKITVLGEVARPGNYTIPTERLNIFEAVGLAGDITEYGRRDNVLLIRESDGKRELMRLNLGDPMVFSSPFYFLKQNDIIAVESNKYKNRQKEDVTLKYIAVGASIISTAAIVISVLKR